MAAIPPELYLSLLSGYGDLSYISSEPRFSGHQFGEDLMDLLDALAAICVHKEKGETYFVSLAMDSDSTTLYISSNETVPATVTNYFYRIRDQLERLHDIMLESNSSADDETSHNNTQQYKQGKLELQKTIYEHVYPKLRRRFFKRVPAILKEYPSIMAGLETEGIITTDDASVLRLIQQLLPLMEKRLRQEKLASDRDLAPLIAAIEALCGESRLKDLGDVNFLTRWDDLIHTKFDAAQSKILSLRRLLEKLSTLHHHIHHITRVASSLRLSQFLKGKFLVVPVQADLHHISIKFSQRDLLPIIFPPGNQVNWDVQSRVCDRLLDRLRVTITNEGLDFKTGMQLSMDIKVHAECALLVYHLQHPDTNPYQYFGGSKLSCRGCSTYFTSYNRVAESLFLPQFFTKGSHNKIDLRWPCPFLLSPEQRLRDKGPTVDTLVRKDMVDILSAELARYVEELREIAQAPSTSLFDPTLDEFLRANAGF